MKSWYFLFTILFFSIMTSSISANELSFSYYEKSTFENPIEKTGMEGKNDFLFTNSDSKSSKLQLISLQTSFPCGIDNTTNSTGLSSGRISSARKYMELTPLWGYTMGGKFEDEENDETLKIADKSNIGFRLAYDYDDNSQIEFLYSHQETELSGGDLFPRDALFDLDVDYFHIGGSLLWDRGSRVEPYFTGTMGLTRFDPQDSGANSLTRFSMGFGGGVRYFPARRFGIYTGARGLVTFVNADIHAYSSSEGSYVTINADAIWQFQVFAGMIFVF